MRSLLEVDRIDVSFGGRTALADVGLRADRGHITGLIGPNGAGKSTLFDVISGLRRPSRGSVVLDGTDVTTRSPAQRSRRGMARTFQRLELFGRLSVRDNLLVAAELGPRRSEARAVVDELIARCALEAIADTTADSLSTGTGRLVEVARALAAQPSVILLDEPAAGQDPDETARFAALLRSVADEGVAVLLVEHDMELVMSVCDTIHVLDLGRIVCVGPPDVVRRDETVVAAYLGRTEDAAAPHPSEVRS